MLKKVTRTAPLRAVSQFTQASSVFSKINVPQGQPVGALGTINPCRQKATTLDLAGLQFHNKMFIT